jgi:hypothetical protein
MRSLRIFGIILLLAVGTGCSHPPPPVKAPPVPPVQSWLAGARAAQCSDAEELTWMHNAAEGMEMIAMSCDGRGVNISHNDSAGSTNVYPVDAATFTKAWQDTLAQVSEQDCMTSDEIASGRKLDSAVTLDVQYKRSILGCADTASRVAEAALRNALVHARREFKGPLQSCCSKHPPCRALRGTSCW